MLDPWHSEQMDHWLESNDPFSHEPNFEFYTIIQFHLVKMEHVMKTQTRL